MKHIRLFARSFFWPPLSPFEPAPPRRRLSVSTIRLLPDAPFSHATIVISPQQTLTDATMIIEDGIIREAGRNLTIPEGTVEIDLTGKTLYPAFIDPFCEYGVPSPTRGRRRWGCAPK